MIDLFAKVQVNIQAFDTMFLKGIVYGFLVAGHCAWKLEMRVFALASDRQKPFDMAGFKPSK